MNGNTKWVNAVAPVRVCDIGGWTDTWFAKYGEVFSIAVYPYVEVQIQLSSERKSNKNVFINVENFDEGYNFTPARRIRGTLGEIHTTRPGDEDEYGKHPLIEMALDVMDFPKDSVFRVNIYSDAPPGASMGTSAAVSIALIGALSKLTNGHLTAHEVAILAHRIETDHLKLQCGVQDQLGSAYGGINMISINRFPHASVSPININDALWWELEQRLVTIYMGKPHKSSDVHQQVIKELGENAYKDNRIEHLRRLAILAKNSLLDGDLENLGGIMDMNTKVQEELHPDLVCDKAANVIEASRKYGALGCKVNGAGGDGGSVTILFDGDRFKKREFIKEIPVIGEGQVSFLPTYLARRGLRVW